MKKLLIILLFVQLGCFGQTIVSWNIRNFGEAKFKRDTIFTSISAVLKSLSPDIIAIQEVSTSKYGDSAVAKLASIMGYSYSISKATSGEGTERYAFIYKKNIKCSAKLDQSMFAKLDREPYVGVFKIGKKTLTIRTVHIVPESKIPQAEIAELYTYTDGIICGDFNLTDKHVIFVPLLTTFVSPLYGELTSLKRDGKLNKAYDHFLVAKKHKIKKAYVYLYPYKYNRNLLSDHLPIVLVLGN